MSTSTSPRSHGLGVAAAVAAGLIGAIVWAVVTTATGWRIGFLAVGVGALVGFAAGRFGPSAAKGTLPVLAAAVAFVSVAVGDTYGWASSASGTFRDQAGLDVSATSIFRGLISGSLDIQGRDFPVREAYKEDFSFMLLVFLAIGVAAAFRICRSQLEAVGAPAPAFPPPAGPAAWPAPPAQPAPSPWDSHGNPTGPPAPISFEKPVPPQV